MHKVVSYCTGCLESENKDHSQQMFALVSAHQESGKYTERWLTRLFDKLHIVITHSSGMITMTTH